jgi:hypothetical protein
MCSGGAIRSQLAPGETVSAIDLERRAGRCRVSVL